MKKIFVDTSGWIAILVSSDQYHNNAVKIYLECIAAGCNFVTHEGILLEVGNALAGSKSRETVIHFLATVSNSSRIELIPFSPSFIDDGWNLFFDRMDKEWGIVDCLSFVLMKNLELKEALSADRHFEQAGFRKLL